MRILALALAAAAVIPTAASAHSARPGHVDRPREAGPVVRSHARAALAQPPRPPGLPIEWCGSPTRDDTPGGATAPHFKLVYAHAADRPNRFSRFADALQGNVAVISRYVAAAALGRKTVRFDMGTSCGPEYVDVQIVRLPFPAADYAGAGAEPEWSSAIRDLSGLLPRRDERARNHLVFLDGLGGDSLAGVGQIHQGRGHQHGAASDTADPAANPHSRGGLFSLVFGPGGAPPAPGERSYAPDLFLHEAFHNLGAVQWSAPHSTSGGEPNAAWSHCTDEQDLMCYSDGGPAADMERACKAGSFVIWEPIDCGQDDYFSPEPRGYLASAWNVYQSPFLGSCDELAPACAGGDLAEPDARAVVGSRTVTAPVRWLRRGQAAGRPLARLTARVTWYADSHAAMAVRATPVTLGRGRWVLSVCVDGRCRRSRRQLRRRTRARFPTFTLRESRASGHAPVWVELRGPGGRRASSRRARRPTLAPLAPR